MYKYNGSYQPQEYNINIPAPTEYSDEITETTHKRTPNFTEFWKR
jgi:hypothetical protein